MSLEKAIEAIKRHKNFLIVSHVDLEGDSIGSQFALRILLEKLDKRCVIVNESAPAPQYDFLDIRGEVVVNLNKHIDYEAVVILDCPVTKRIGRATKFLSKTKTLINIDHHISNTNFGNINWVEPDVSSCGEMIYKLYRRLNVPIYYRCALFLYTAILTDTGSFAYECTSSDTHTIAAELIGKGLKPDVIYQALYENKTVSEVGLLRDTLSTLRLTKDGKIAYMYVSRKMLKTFRLGLDVTEGFINYARSVRGAKIAIIFLESPWRENQVQISFRSKGETDVDRLAGLFGGGGHRKASGCVIEGRLKAVIKKVLDAVGENI